MRPTRLAVAFRVAVLAMIGWHFASAAGVSMVLVAHLATQGDIGALLPLGPIIFFLGVAKMALRETARGLRGGGGPTPL
jgi:formate hydrogenlyase subunit 4